VIRGHQYRCSSCKSLKFRHAFSLDRKGGLKKTCDRCSDLQKERRADERAQNETTGRVDTPNPRWDHLGGNENAGDWLKRPLR
jgi:hypothetical protein